MMIPRYFSVPNTDYLVLKFTLKTWQVKSCLLKISSLIRTREKMATGFARYDLCDSGTASARQEDKDFKRLPFIRKANDGEVSSKAKNGLRPIFFRSGAIPKAPGSAYVEAGRAKIMCAVYGPRPDSRAAHFTEVGRIYCHARFAPFCGLESSMAEKLEKELPLLVRPALEAAVLLHKFPKSVIEIYLLVLEWEGDIPSMAISCASMALADSGIDMFDLVASCSVIKRANGELVVDPCGTDLQDCPAYVMTSLMPVRGEITQFSQHGIWDGETLQKGIDMTLEGARQIHTLMRSVLSQETTPESEISDEMQD